VTCHEAIPAAAPCAIGCVLYEHSGTCECSERLRMNNAGASPAIRTTWGKQQVAQVSKRVYPLVYARESVSSPNMFTTKTMVIREDDEGFINDTVGSFVLDRGACRADVFAQGLPSGWTGVKRHFGDGDIAFVDVKFWCSSR
jgi:hypothetical protein